MIRPRRPDQRLLRSITDAGLPAPQGSVEVTALRQVSRAVPTAAVVEGRFTPWRITNSLTSFVVEHPKARFIVDPSICMDVEQRTIAQLPAVLRMAVRPPAGAIATVEALRELPGPPPLDFALPTHAHWDHVCGLLDLRGLPVHLHRPEHEWISGGPVAPTGGVRDALRDRPIVEFELDGPPIPTFTRSHDLFGDSTVLLVDLAGHTPGSIGVLAHTERGWILLAGEPRGTPSRSTRFAKRQATQDHCWTRTATAPSKPCTGSTSPATSHGSSPPTTTRRLTGSWLRLRSETHRS